MQLDLTPLPQESLGEYVRRLRQGRQMTQAQLAQAAGLHRQSVAKIESGRTTRLQMRARNGLAHALGIAGDYLDAVCLGESVPSPPGLKFCPQCWVPGSPPDPIWMEVRSQFCFICGTALCSRCSNCQEPIQSLKFRFCPYCGTAYKASG
jgi:DNA-binding XRE family transcriptional regulator